MFCFLFQGSKGGASGVGSGGSSKRRSHVDSVPDSEKPYSCERKLEIIQFSLQITKNSKFYFWLK